MDSIKKTLESMTVEERAKHFMDQHQDACRQQKQKLSLVSAQTIDRIKQKNSERAMLVGEWEKKADEVPVWQPEKIGLPTEYFDCSFKNYEDNPALIKRLSAYKKGGLVLHGPCGSGKTHLAIALLRHFEQMEWIEHCWDNIKKAQNDNPVSEKPRSKKLFLSIPRFLMAVMNSFNDQVEVTQMELLNKYSHVPFLVLDDLGVEKASDFSILTLYLLLDHRVSNGLDTVITTNLSLDEIESKLSSRISSRLAGWDNVNITMPDRRKGK